MRTTTDNIGHLPAILRQNIEASDRATSSQFGTIRPSRPAAHGRGISPTVYITRPDADKLEKITDKRGVSVCEVIRRLFATISPPANKRIL